MAAAAGLAFQASLKENKASREGLGLHGEIDLIAADTARSRIWVIEAKHLRQAFSPLETGARIADFHGQAALTAGPATHEYRQFRSRTFRPYVQRVLANTRAVIQNTDAAIRLISRAAPAYGLTARARDDWEVIPLIVTTHIDVSAFVDRPAGHLRSDRPPTGTPHCDAGLRPLDMYPKERPNRSAT